MMLKRAATLAAVLAVATAATSAAAHRSSPSPLLAVTPKGLVRVDPLTLKPVGKRFVPVAGFGAWSVSPDRRLVALASQDRPVIRFVDTRRMRAAGRIVLGRAGTVGGLDWLRPRVLVAMLEGFRIVALDPVSRRVLWRRTTDGPVRDVAATGDALVFLVSNADGIGPATLQVIGVDGTVRSLILDRILAGSHFDPDAETPIGEIRSPGLAVDPDGNRAYVVGADEPVAEIDLGSLAVTYHGALRTLAKAVTGPSRLARWLGSGLVAVTGEDDRAWLDASGKEQQIRTPVGVTLVDTRDWTARRIDSGASTITVADGLVLAYGGGWDSTKGDQQAGVGLAAYGPDGSARFHLFGQIAVYWVQAANGLAYVWLPATRVAVVDLGSGRVLRTISPPQDTLLLIGS